MAKPYLVWFLYQVPVLCSKEVMSIASRITDSAKHIIVMILKELQTV